MDMKDVVQVLKTAPRMGAEKDEPEGSRFIQLSETLVDKIVQELESWIVPAIWVLPEDFVPIVGLCSICGGSEWTHTVRDHSFVARAGEN